MNFSILAVSVTSRAFHNSIVIEVADHYKKMGFRLRLKNAAIDPKNAAIGYSCVYKRGLNTAAIGL